MLALTSVPPETITLQQHAELTSSTPASFEDIPPVLKFLDEEVEVEFDPVWEEVSGRVGGRVKGTLWVTERSITFLPTSLVSSTTSSTSTALPSASQKGLTLPYPTLTLHAISPSSDTSPAFLYCQLDDPSAGSPQSVGGHGPNGASNGNGSGNGDGINGAEDGDSEDGEEGEEGEDEDSPMRELKVYLKSTEQLNHLFSALSYCSSLYPSLDPTSSSYRSLDHDGDAQEQALNFGSDGMGGFDERLLDGIQIPGMEGEGEGQEGEFEDAEEDGKDGEGGQVDPEAGRTRSDFRGADPRFKPY